MRSDKVNPKKKYPPAYYRYRKNHLTLSILLSNDLRGYLDTMRNEGMTYPQIIKDALDEGKWIYEKVQREYKAKLNEETAKCREEIKKAFLEEQNRLREEMEIKARREIKQDISNIWKDLNTRLKLDVEAQEVIMEIFRNHGYPQNEEAFS